MQFTCIELIIKARASLAAQRSIWLNSYKQRCSGRVLPGHCFQLLEKGVALEEHARNHPL